MNPVTGIDHVLILTRDLADAAARYRRIGFTVTPRGEHSGQGTHNHCVMLAGQYLELLGVAVPGERNRNWQDMLKAGYEGPAAIALATPDEKIALAHLKAAGLDQGDAMRLTRPVEIDGGTRLAEFGIVRVATATAPWLKTFFCRHFTPELVWRPEWMRHANGAEALCEVIVLHDALKEAKTFFARLAGVPAVRLDERGLRVRLGAVDLWVMNGAQFSGWNGGLDAPKGARTSGPIGLALKVSDLAATSRVLEKSRVFMTGGAAEIIIPPPEAGGAMLKFIA